MTKHILVTDEDLHIREVISLSRSQALETMKVLNNITHPKAMLYRVPKLSEKQPENPKNRVKKPCY
jgi:hypothetical protein